MIKFENVDVHGFEAAIRGMRNPLESWEKSDSWFFDWDDTENYTCTIKNINQKREKVAIDDLNSAMEDWDLSIGDNDWQLMTKLAKAGSEHAKFRRMINVTVDITAPLYWWKEFDTYKVGTVANSCSTMHCIHKKEFTLDDFSTDHLTDSAIEDSLEHTIKYLNTARDMFIAKEGKSKAAWWQMIQLLPTSYNQKRTVQMNYEVLANIYRQRQGHKLDEWHDFISWIETLPYKEVICG